MNNENSFVKDIERICSKNAQIHEINGEVFSSIPLHHISHKDTAKAVCFDDLSSLVPILKREIEMFNLPVYIVVNGYNEVRVLTALDNERERENPYIIRSEHSPFSFGRVYGYEDFVIALRSMFVQNEDSKQLLALLKKITDSNSVSVEDDGITQKVTSSKGILTSNQNAAPIRRLAPYRTFSEIEQPTSEFLFRIKDGGGFALYEADGGAWKLKAKKSIKDYYSDAFKEEIESGKVIIVS